MSDRLAWGIISTGAISKTFARALAGSRTGALIAVASRMQGKADAFGEEFNVPRRYGSYEALLADPDVQAVYISTPHPMHAEWAIKAADAGKHILCEKPLTLNYPEAMAVIEAARRNDVFLMEAFMYRCHPQTPRLVELIRDRAIGDVRVIQATFSFHTAFNPEGRLLNNALGGGGILDVGCYCTSMARLIAGAALGVPFAEPIEVKASGRIGDVSRVDEYAVGILRFPGDIMAQIAAGVQLNQENVVRIFGSEGNILAPSPWMPGESAKIIVHRYGEPQPREILIGAGANVYAMEADTVAANIERSQAPSPAMTWDDTLGNMRTLDRWRLAIGMTYDAEKPDVHYPTVDGRPLQVRTRNNMRYGTIQGAEKSVSRLVMGAVLEGAMFVAPHAAVSFDEFFASGGNCFDTAHIYGGGICERVLGQWVKSRGIREQVVILGKGAHTPYCNPDHLTAQLLESLDRLQTDYVDIYMLHRDNPEIPVGEFVDALNEHRRAGRIRAFGGSNWSVERVEAANEYARSKGLAGFAAVSDNFSLARMIEPPWPGCIAASDPESRAWFAKTQMPLMAWSSTARGFFVWGDRDNLSNPGLVQSWYSEDNFQRLERAKEMAARRGVLPVQIAMAYVLCQPFPTFALFGPASLTEMHTSLQALDIELTPEEMKWLNLEV
ncbi:MAG TPA: aldo/keto reductase [Armatimonadota bacterium]|nr:aldo/keto reductase [Armatimonadota bacterium]